MYRKSDRKAKTLSLLARSACVLIFLFLTAPAPVTATPSQPVYLPVLVATAQQLGWPASTSPRRDLPGQALQIANEGQAQISTMWAAIHISSNADEPDLLDLLEQRGMTRGLYHGYEAIIVRTGDPATTRQETGGLIAWRCGPYSFMAEDTTLSGRETEIAETLYSAAQERDLCASTGTVLILAETSETPGTNSLSLFQSRAKSANWYYSLNGYGRTDLGFTFMDADGPSSDHDWYHVGDALSSYSSARSFGEAVLAQAFSGADLPEVVTLERAILIYAGESQQPEVPWCSPASTVWLPRDYAIEIQGAEHSIRLYVANLVILSEQEGLGTWVHEIGHTLHASREASDEFGRIPDRYGQPIGYVGHWDLMGLGCLWGVPERTSPTQMSSYTKVAAGWLRYQAASEDRDYVLTSLENQKMGDGVLTVDDPLNDDPRDYYILEARDSEVFFGAPESGVMIYHITYDREAGRAVVEILNAQRGDREAQRMAHVYPRTTLHEAVNPQGATEYAIPGGLVVRLLAESLSPYRATVRIERSGAE